MFFLSIFDQCPILTCPGMTNYHNISDLDKTCCVNYTCNGKVKTKNLPNERAYRPLRIKIGRQIVRNQEEEGTENLDDAILVPVRESLRARRRQAAYKHKWRSGWRAWRRLNWCLWSWWWWIKHSILVSQIEKSSLQKISWISSFRDIWQKWIVWYFLADILTLGDRLGPMWYLGNVWTSKIYVWLPPHSKKYFRHPGTNFTYLGGPAT